MMIPIDFRSISFRDFPATCWPKSTDGDDGDDDATGVWQGALANVSR